MIRNRFVLLSGGILLSLTLIGQEGPKVASGRISFISSQNIYVKFESTKGILPGDTLFISRENRLIPAMIVENRSSISCVGKPLPGLNLGIGNDLVANKKHFEPVAQLIKAEERPVNDQITEEVKPIVLTPEPKQSIKGRLFISSFSNFSNTEAENTQRFRYNFSLLANNINDSRFSAETYLSFSHRLNHGSEVRENVFNALKIYSLALGYQAGKNSSLWLGRKINPKVSNIGAIDGLQAETRLRNYSFGAVAGTRPNDADYSFNSKLFEYGAYASHNFATSTGTMQNSVAFFNQTNSGMTDRRYFYFQHDNSLVANFFFFSSCEVDAYRIISGEKSYSPSLTSVFLSLRYRVSPKLSASVSFDARKNVIYYETYKNFIDQLLEDATRQGWQLRINYRPWNSVSMGVTGGFRFREGDLRPTRNVNGFISFSQIPWLKASATLTANYLETSYLNGKIIGLALSRDFLSGKLNSTLNYRFLDYTYTISGSSSLQQIAELSLSWQFSRTFSLSVDYELTLDKSYNFQRVYLNLIYRF